MTNITSVFMVCCLKTEGDHIPVNFPIGIYLTREAAKNAVQKHLETEAQWWIDSFPSAEVRKQTDEHVIKVGLEPRNWDSELAARKANAEAIRAIVPEECYHNDQHDLDKIVSYFTTGYFSERYDAEFKKEIWSKFPVLGYIIAIAEIAVSE